MLKIEQQATPYLVTLEFDTKQLNLLFDQHWETIKDDIELEGFRKGNVPKEVAEKKIGFEKLYSKVIPNQYSQEIKDLNFVYSNEPKIFGVFNREGHIKLTTECFLTPAVKLGDLSKINFENETIFVDDLDINRELERRKHKHATKVETNKPIEKGDLISLDFVGYIDDVEIQGAKAFQYQLIVGKSNMVAGFEEELIGLSPNETKSFTVMFPATYHRGQLAGKEAKFEVKIHNVYVYEIAQEDFVKLESCNSYDELVENIKQELLTEKETAYKKEKTARIIKQLVETSEIEPIPTPCIYQELDEKLKQFVINSGKTVEELKEQFSNFEEVFELNNKEIIIEGIRSTLVLQELQKKFDISVTDEQIQEFCSKKYGENVEKDTTRYFVAASQLKLQQTIDKVSAL